MTQRKNTANKLSQKHKHEIIQMLAAFEKPKTIVEHLKAHHGIRVTERNIYFYLESRDEDIESERERIRHDLRAIPIVNLFYRLMERQRLLDDLKNHLWIEVPLTRNDKAIIDENGNPKIVKKRGNHSVINQLLDSAAKELQPLQLDAIKNEDDTPNLSREEIARRIVALLDTWLIEQAQKVGEPKPTVEVRAKMIAELIEHKHNGKWNK